MQEGARGKDPHLGESDMLGQFDLEQELEFIPIFPRSVCEEETKEKTSPRVEKESDQHCRRQETGREGA